jgi:hypothetical protein
LQIGASIKRSYLKEASGNSGADKVTEMRKSLEVFSSTFEMAEKRTRELEDR